MTLEGYYFISQIVAAAAVVASLVFVGLQLRAQVRQSRIEARRNLAREIRDVLHPLSHSVASAEVYAKGLDKSLAALPPGERVHLVAVMHNAFKTVEMLYYENREGLLEQHLWDTTWAQMTGTLATEAGQSYWHNRKDHYGPEFRDFVDRAEIAYTQGRFADSVPAPEATAT